MAKVSLRIYNREIESLIDQGNTNEAIAHCHHILKIFSKHLATYRLLGKAYLELKRYNEAVDVLGRVLMSVPDDFVSHVGMSIINDEENKLDNAIWHMERAFEAQPSNAAIQGELQRLYGRRDGMEPPKIRMTRGALAHMYVQGELYPQAIAEIRAVLSQDPNRADMQALLARAYFRGGQKADASDMCAQLLKRYAYCFDANRIMVDLLPSTLGAAESTQVYRMRVGELDPYATFSKGSVFQSDEVADAAINLERLEYTEETPSGQNWSSSALGLKSGAPSVPTLTATSSPNEPDWLKSGGFSDSPPNPFAPPQTPDQNLQSVKSVDDEIPNFLRDAGWGTSNSAEQPVSFFDEEEPASGGLTPAEIPDWLKGQAPPNAQPAAPRNEPAQTIETPDWLSGLDTPQTFGAEPAQAVDVPDWLSGLGEPQASANEPIQTGDVPDWLSGLGGPQASAAEPAQTGDVPAWMSGLGAPQAPAVEPAQTGDVPDWMSGLGTSQASANESVQAGDVPDWLSGLDTPQSTIAEPVQTDNIPDWLSSKDSQSQNPSQQPASSVEDLGSTAQEQDDAVAWLESLAAKHGAKPEELVTDPNKRFEKPPEWVSQAQNLNQEKPVPQTPAGSVESLGSTAQEQDDAVAWLESLAAKHGAKPEELVTDPSKRFEKPPEWVSQAQSIGEAQSASESEIKKSNQQPEIVENALNIGEQFFAEFESASTAAPATDETSAWLLNLDEEEQKVQPSSNTKDIPDWLSDSQSKPEKTDEQNLRGSDMPEWLEDAEKDAAPQNTLLPENDLSNWLSGLDDEPGLPFDSVTTPDAILFSSKSSESAWKPESQEPAAAKSDLPDWLSDVDAHNADSSDEWKSSVQEEPAVPVSKPEETPAPISQAENVPDWLQNLNEEEMPLADDDTPPWQHREKWEAEVQQPMPTSPSDWHPIESKQPESAPIQRQEIPIETPKYFAQQDVPPAQPVSAQPTVQPIPQLESTKKKKLGLPARKQQSEGSNTIVGLSQAKSELDRGDIPAALAHYGKLIKKGKHLEETIRDLSESIYRYPVEVGIWQTLGDAYMRANRLKEALEAYNKAEELIR
jgi:tetratricopeptide (TPR) repeat protein